MLSSIRELDLEVPRPGGGKNSHWEVLSAATAGLRAPDNSVAKPWTTLVRWWHYCLWTTKHPSSHRMDPAQTCCFASLAPKSKMVHLCRQVEPESRAYLSWKGGWEWDYLNFWLSQWRSCHWPRLPSTERGFWCWVALNNSQGLSYPPFLSLSACHLTFSHWPPPTSIQDMD